MKRAITITSLMTVAVPACGDSPGQAETSETSSNETGTNGDGDGDGGGDADAETEGDGDGDGDGDAACPAGALGQQLGRDRLLIGGSMEDDAFNQAQFDLRYQYLSGAVPSDGPCDDCASGCVVEGQSCDNQNGCAWWGCWQYDQDPPGRFVIDYIAAAEAAGAVPMLTYYVWFSVAGYVEAAPEIAALQDGARVASYLADWRFLAQRVAEATDEPVIVHVEPDLWGYGQQVNVDPTQIPVAIAAAGASECGGLDDDFAGFAACLRAIAAAEAPNMLIGFHASAWGAGADALINEDPNFDVVAHAQQTAAYMNALGADEADLVIVEMSDRDAGFNDRWWDASDQTLPNFTQALDWTQALGQAMELPTLWWQVPYGHEGLDDVCDRYRDNRVDYVFDHPERFAEIGSLGVAFGAGTTCMTTPATDDGHFVQRSQSYFASERPCLCGACQ